jgi:hypothetical protein
MNELDHTAAFSKLTIQDVPPPDTDEAPNTSVSTGAHQGSNATEVSDDDWVAQTRESVNELADQWSCTFEDKDFSNYDKARSRYIAVLEDEQLMGDR